MFKMFKLCLFGFIEIKIQFRFKKRKTPFFSNGKVCSANSFDNFCIVSTRLL